MRLVVDVHPGWSGGAGGSQRLRAFTLVELLVVVAVLALLAMLLAPALKRGRDAARTSACAARMRQVGLAMLSYATDNQDRFPRSQHSAFTHGELVWERALAPYLQSSASGWRELLKNVYRCPADARAASLLSYGVNVYFELDAEEDDYEGKPATWRYRAAVSKPSGTVYLAENNSSADHIMPNFWAAAAEAEDVASTRHNGLANYTFVDGHVEMRDLLTIYDPPKIDRWHPERVP